MLSGSSSIGRAIAFQAIGREFDPRLPLIWFCRCSSVVEHFLGREEVVSSILTNGSALSGEHPAFGGKVVGTISANDKAKRLKKQLPQAG